MILESYLKGGDFDPAIGDLGHAEIERVVSDPANALRLVCDEGRRLRIESACGLRKSKVAPWVERGIEQAFSSQDPLTRARGILLGQSLFRSDRPTFALGIQAGQIRDWLKAVADGRGAERMPAFDDLKGAVLLFDPVVHSLEAGVVRSAAGLVIGTGLSAAFGLPALPHVLQAKVAAVMSYLKHAPDGDDGPASSGGELSAAGLDEAAVGALKASLAEGRASRWLEGALGGPVDIERLWKSERFRAAATCLGFHDLDPAIFDPDASPITDPWVQKLRHLCASPEAAVSDAARTALRGIPAQHRRSRMYAIQALASARVCSADDAHAICTRELAHVLQGGASAHAREVARFGGDLLSAMLADRLSMPSSQFDEHLTRIAGPAARKWFSAACRRYMVSPTEMLGVDVPVELLKGLRPDAMAGIPRWAALVTRCEEWIARARDMEAAADAASAGRTWLVELVQRCVDVKPQQYDGGLGILDDADRATVQVLQRERAARQQGKWYRKQLPLQCEMRLMEAFARTTGQVPEGLRPVAEAVGSAIMVELTLPDREYAKQHIRECVEFVVSGSGSASAALLGVFRRSDHSGFLERLRGADVTLPAHLAWKPSASPARTAALACAGCFAAALLFEPVACRSTGQIPDTHARSAAEEMSKWRWLPQAKVWIARLDGPALERLFGPLTLQQVADVDAKSGSVSAGFADEAIRRYGGWLKVHSSAGVPRGPEPGSKVARWTEGVTVRLPRTREADEARGMDGLGVQGAVWSSEGGQTNGGARPSSAAAVLAVIDAGF